MTGPPRPRPLTWSPRLVLWHWLVARLSLLTAGLIVLLHPADVVGSPLLPATLATAHVLVLGFVAISITGAWHAVAPLVLGAPHHSRRLDWVLLATLALVAAGVVSHMLLGTYSGVAWSAGLLALLLLLRLPAWLLALATGKAPPAIAVGTALAWIALVLTVCLGGAIAVDRYAPFLPVAHTTALLGHAHLGLGGFAALMVVSLGMRLLPMLLPAAPPRGMGPWVAVLLTAAGGLGMGLLVPFVPTVLPVCALLLAFGLVAFLLLVAGMIARPRPAPADQPRPDPVHAHAAMALLSLLAALGLGLALAFGGLDGPGNVLAYGVCAVLGFLGSLILGVGTRLLPWAGWFHAWQEHPELPRPPRTVGSVPLAWLVFATWSTAVVLLAIACRQQAPGLARAAGLLLLVATLSDTHNLRRSWQRRAPAPPTAATAP